MCSRVGGRAAWWRETVIFSWKRSMSFTAAAKEESKTFQSALIIITSRYQKVSTPQFDKGVRNEGNVENQRLVKWFCSKMLNTNKMNDGNYQGEKKLVRQPPPSFYFWSVIIHTNGSTGNLTMIQQIIKTIIKLILTKAWLKCQTVFLCIESMLLVFSHLLALPCRISCILERKR